MCVVMNLCMCEADRLRSPSSVIDRHMISIKVLHLFLLLLSSVYPSLTKELKLQSSSIQAQINQDNF